jgi:gliding motility-associated-like protein
MKKHLFAAFLLFFAATEHAGAQCAGMTPVNLGGDTVLCPGQTMTLNAGAGYSSYLWNNGSINPSRFVSVAGTYWVKVGLNGPNAIVNGDFESGNTAFTTQYAIGTGGSWGLVSLPGTYAITATPHDAHSNFVTCGDHTAAPGTQQMVVNGADVANTKVWCQTVPTSPNTDYQFGTWVTSVEAGFNVAQLQFTVNNTQIGSVFSPSTTGCSWSQFTTTWSSGMTTSADICIINQNTNGAGNDFALDDITFRPVCYDYDTIAVTYSTNPVVSLGAGQNLCEGTPVTLDAQNPGMNYLWNNGATTQTVSPTASGTYSVTVKNQYNCSASSSVAITFEAQKHAGADSAATLCNTAQQLDLSGLLAAGSTTGGTWQTGALPGGNVTPAGIASTTTPGTFDYDYVLTGVHCPNDTARMTITVNRQPVAAADQFLHYCNASGETHDLSAYLTHPSAPNAPVWSADPDLPAGSFDAASGTLTMTGIPHGAYDLYNVLPADSMCVSDTTAFTIDVTAMPQVAFSSDTTEGCITADIVYYNASTVYGSVQYFWDFGNGQTSAAFTDIPVGYDVAGCYDVSLTITADGLCTSSLTKPDMICAHPLPEASFDFAPQQVYSDGPLVNFHNTSSGAAQSSWSFGDGESSSQSEPVHTYPLGDAGNYLVELIVTSPFGCTDTTTRVVVVKDQLLYFIPNAFTPDGDEYNNVFQPVMTAGMDPLDYVLLIYDRWGETIFESRDISAGWDGTYNGSLLPAGTYTWRIEFGMMDTDEKRTDTGHVSLLR